MKRRHVRKKVIVYGLGALLFCALLVVVALSLHGNRTRQTEVDYDDMHMQLMELADSVKTEQSYSTLSEDKRQAFLDSEATRYALDPRFEQVTPDTLRAACVETAEGMIIDTAGRIRTQIGREAFEEHSSLFMHAKAAARANCYTNFDPTGKEAIPDIMVHP